MREAGLDIWAIPRGDIIAPMLEVLGYSSVYNALRNSVRGERALGLLDYLKPYKSSRRLKEELDCLNQAITLIAMEAIAVPETMDLRPTYEKGHKGMFLTPNEALDYVTEAEFLLEVKKAVQERLGEGPLYEAIRYAEPNRSLVSSIERVYGPDGRMKDTASSGLSSVRKSLRDIEGSMLSICRQEALRYQSALAMKEPLFRDGRYVLGVSVSYKHSVDGLILGYSGSGETAYVLPRKCLEKENEAARLREEERREIRKIEEGLLKRFIAAEEEVLYLNERVAYLDFLFAKAKYALAEEANVPEYLPEESLIDLKALRHPSIPKKEAIPNDFYFDKSSRLMVLTGPNAGGKSVALKAVGLAAYCFSCALPVLCREGSRMAQIPTIYADIGDSQSIEEALSTFSAHMKAVGKIVDKAKESDLVILDELGTGTSPGEGEAIAVAVAEELLHKGCLVMISSHFEGLKTFALEAEGAFNASMGYKEEGYAPSYVLRLGLPGSSHSLAAAVRYGLPREIADRAKEILDGKSEASLSKTLEKLEETAKFQEKKAKEAIEKLGELEEKEARLRDRETKLKAKEETFRENLAKEKEELVEKAKEEIKRILSTLKGDIKPHQAIQAKKELEGLLDASEEETSGPKDFKENDYVYIPTVGAYGRISSMSGNKAVVNGSDGFTYKVDLGKLEHAEERKTVKKEKPITYLDGAIKPKAPLEINLIGMRREEAKEALEAYLDACRLNGNKRVRIIHGLGSGALRNMVRETLDRHSEFVASYENAGEREGGLGATIAHLR